MTIPRRPELIVHTFLPVDAPETIGKLWTRITDSGLDQPVRSYPQRPEGSPGGGIVAAAREVVPGQVHEAVVYRTPALVVVSVRRAPNDSAIGWPVLRQWQDGLGPPPAEALGTATVLLGQWSRSRWRADPSPARLAEIVRPHLPSDIQLGSPHETADGLLLWEIAAEDDIHRRLLVLGPARAEETVDRWAWYEGGPALPPLTRYLSHAAAIRHEASLLHKALPRLRTARARVDQGSAVLDHLLRSPRPAETAVAAADQALSAMLTEESGLLIAESDAADMAQTAAIARRAMVASLDLDTSRPAGGPPASDLEIASWLEEQVATELTYLRSAGRKAAELSRLASAVIEQRRHRRQEKLTLLQASIVGALLMALAASQTFTYKVPIHRSGPILGPLIVVLATLALLLPAAVIYWPDRARSARLGRRQLALYLLSAIVLGLEAGWLGASVGWVLRAHHAAPAHASLLVAGGAAVLMALVTIVSLTLSRIRRRP
jgi:uncharacterized membrane protein YsdA (DUF1294 family)